MAARKDARFRSYLMLAFRLLLTMTLTAKGLAELTGSEAMAAAFARSGFGALGREGAGLLSLAAMVLLWIPGWAVGGAALATIVMLGAAAAHVVVLGPPVWPQLLLALAAAALAWDDLPAGRALLARARRRA